MTYGVIFIFFRFCQLWRPVAAQHLIFIKFWWHYHESHAIQLSEYQQN